MIWAIPSSSSRLSSLYIPLPFNINISDFIYGCFILGNKYYLVLQVPLGEISYIPSLNQAKNFEVQSYKALRHSA